MGEEVKVPRRVLKVVERLRAGEKLVVEVPTRGGRRLFFWEPSGRIAGQRSIEQAIALRLIVPVGDGLFGDTQTWAPA